MNDYEELAVKLSDYIDNDLEALDPVLRAVGDLVKTTRMDSWREVAAYLGGA